MKMGTLQEFHQTLVHTMNINQKQNKTTQKSPSISRGFFVTAGSCEMDLVNQFFAYQVSLSDRCLQPVFHIHKDTIRPFYFLMIRY